MQSLFPSLWTRIRTEDALETLTSTVRVAIKYVPSVGGLPVVRSSYTSFDFLIIIGNSKREEAREHKNAVCRRSSLPRFSNKPNKALHFPLRLHHIFHIQTPFPTLKNPIKHLIHPPIPPYLSQKPQILNSTKMLRKKRSRKTS